MRKLIKKLLNEGLLVESLFHGTNRKELNWGERNEDPDYNMLGYGIYLTDIEDEAKYYAKKKKDGTKYVHTFRPMNANIVNWDGPLPKNILSYVNDNSEFFLFGNDNEIEFDDYEVDTKDGTLEWDFLGDDLPEWAIEDGASPGYFIIKYDNNHNQIGDIMYGLSKKEILDIVNKYGVNNTKSIEIDPTIFYGITGVENDELNSKNMLLSVANFYTFLYYKFGSTKKASEFLTKLGIDGVTKAQDTSDFGYSEKVPKVTVIYNPNKFKKTNTFSVK